MGFSAALTITNTGSTALKNWTLIWTYAGNQQVTQSWDGTYTQKGETITINNTAWNGPIAPGATNTGIGLNAAYTGKNVSPTVFYLNGTACN